MTTHDTAAARERVARALTQAMGFDHDGWADALYLADAAIAAMPSVLPTAALDWLPIATAPKDTVILLFCPGDGRQVDTGFYGRWQNDLSKTDHIGFLNGMDEVFPTHWCPLPTPPANPSPATEETEHGR